MPKKPNITKKPNIIDNIEPQEVVPTIDTNENNEFIKDEDSIDEQLKKMEKVANKESEEEYFDAEENQQQPMDDDDLTPMMKQAIYATFGVCGYIPQDEAVDNCAVIYAKIFNKYCPDTSSFMNKWGVEMQAVCCTAILINGLKHKKQTQQPRQPIPQKETTKQEYTI